MVIFHRSPLQDFEIVDGDPNVSDDEGALDDLLQGTSKAWWRRI